MSNILSLSPQLLWKWFDQICAIPHPSHHEQQLAQFIIDWAKNRDLFVEQDEVGNILIRKPATQGMETHPSIALQAHLDMVPQANEGSQHDFIRDPIQPYVDGEWVRAKDTTLGADNGIGLASCLAILEANNIVHPAVEILFTVSEECGMQGAIGLRPNWLQSEIMINTDTENNGEIYIGCAGGEDATLSLPIEYEDNIFDSSITIVLKGLAGGHSGCDIHTTRANAIKLIARLLSEMRNQISFQLVDIRGGSVRNAIPREAQTTIVFNTQNGADLSACIKQFEQRLKVELALAEPQLTIVSCPSPVADKCFTQNMTDKTIHMLNLLPNGVIRNSDAVANVVETSLSAGILNCDNQQVNVQILIRSLIENGKADVRSKLTSLSKLVNGKISFSGSYPSWEPNLQSKITSLVKTIYDEILNDNAQIKVIHAGLECGLIREKYPMMDIVSIGPTIHNAHSPDEKVHIVAVEIYWQLLTKILAKI